MSFAWENWHIKFLEKGVNDLWHRGESLGTYKSETAGKREEGKA